MTLLMLLAVVLLAIGWLVHSTSSFEEFALPVFKGRPVLDRLYGVLWASFWIYFGFRILRPDVARNWSERAVAQDKFWARLTQDQGTRLSVEDRLPMWKGMAKAFAFISFLIGGGLFAYEVVTLFAD